MKTGNFVVRVKGDELVAERISDGDHLVVSASATPLDGDMALVLVRGSLGTVRRYHREDSGSIRLTSVDPQVPPMLLAQHDVEVKGVVVAMIRNYRREVRS